MPDSRSGVVDRPPAPVDRTAGLGGPEGRALDWLNLYVANIQTGFGPFIAVYLTTQGWTQTAIGVALSLGTLTAMLSQVPAGALVDAIARKALVAGFSLLAFMASALLLALSPTPLSVYCAEILHGVSSCTLGPAIAAISLAIAGGATLGIRLGRNTRFASIGNGVGAALMGACGYFVSERAVFFLTAALTVPALFTLRPLRDIGAVTAERRKKVQRTALWPILSDRRLLIFGACAVLFNLANAAMLPLASAGVTKRAGAEASLLIAACIVLPQIIVAVLSPAVGFIAEQRGRRIVLFVCCAMLPVRGVLFSMFDQPLLLVAIQALDGISAACFGVLVPLVTSDVARRSGHFNLALGAVGFAIGIGATLSTTGAGWVADRMGDSAAFLVLALAGLAAVGVVALMPETRPPRNQRR